MFESKDMFKWTRSCGKSNGIDLDRVVCAGSAFERTKHLSGIGSVSLVPNEPVREIYRYYS
jgi:hypothetical protein